MQFSWRKDAAMLAYVVLNGAVPSVAAAGLLWAQSDERGAMNNLRQRLHRLRRDTGARLLEVTVTARLADDLVLEKRPAPSAVDADPTAWDDELLGTLPYDDAGDFSTWLALSERPGPMRGSRRSPALPQRPSGKAAWPARWSMRSASARTSLCPNMRTAG